MGASSGIGRLTAVELARQGATVVVAARDDQALASLVEEIQQAGWKAVAVAADTTLEDDLARVVLRAEELGGIDTWVQVAGVSVYSPVAEMTAAELRQVVAIDLLGPGLAALAAVPALKRKGGGHFLCVSSVEAEVPIPLSGAYAAAKHGVRALLAALRMELQHEGAPIEVTNVMPYSIDTPFFQHAATRLGVQPRPVPPAYDPRRVVEVIMSAIERPRPEIVVGRAGRFAVTMHRLFPRLSEAVIRRIAFRAQRSRISKSRGAANNLFGPVNDDRVRGTEGGAANARIQRGRRARALAGWTLAFLGVVGAGRLLRRRLIQRRN
jgi:short-subunit dehydrogenase